MEENQKSMQEQIKRRLQEETVHFLTNWKIVWKGIEILPKEIELYYYEKYGEFKDDSVHKNDLQKNNKNHFYVHRWGTKQIDPYKGGNRAGIDLVVSDDENIYHSYLIRSAVINGKIIVGPNNVLKKIIEVCGFSNEHLENNYKELECVPVTLKSNVISADVLFSKRINLSTGYVDYELRAVLCDEQFRNAKYPGKEKMIVDFLSEKVHNHNMTNDEAIEYAKDKLNYIPSKIKSLC
ncbi:MAG: hypothetical protein J6X65_02130 [Bacteroidales bacterium]|nr:hypothetical protein [Bacteroidales bacterium]